MNFFSQDNQDKFIADLFKNKRNGVFVDVGAYDGIYYSNTAYFEKELRWTGVCIEPNPEVFKRLEKNRNCLCLNYCISEKKGELQFLSVSGFGEMLSGLINFFDEKHLNRIESIINEHGGNKTVINIPSIPLKDIFIQNSINEIDYCNIDVEGGEITVLNSIDFCKVKIKVFTIENNNRTTHVRDFLRSHGYKLIGKLGADEVYELNSKRYDLMIHWRIKKISNYCRLVWKKISHI
jgi:FkbM family methyltransferase